MFTRVFWMETADRAVRTLAQTMLALWVVGDQMLNVFEFDWANAAGVGLGALVVSVANSLLAAKVGHEGTPSLINRVD